MRSVTVDCPGSSCCPRWPLIATGIACVNQVELQHLRMERDFDFARYGSGLLLAIGAVVCWTWYPMRNADWLRAHADRNPRSWATAQGLMTLPLAVLGYGALWIWSSFGGDIGLSMPFGPTPQRYVLLMLAVGLLASWVGTLCWNEASQRVPTALAGQLIVFETLSALGYALLLRGVWPDALTLAGIALLVAGVLRAVRIKPVPVSPSPP